MTFPGSFCSVLVIFVTAHNGNNFPPLQTVSGKIAHTSPVLKIALHYCLSLTSTGLCCVNSIPVSRHISIIFVCQLNEPGVSCKRHAMVECQNVWEKKNVHHRFYSTRVLWLQLPGSCLVLVWKVVIHSIRDLYISSGCDVVSIS